MLLIDDFRRRCCYWCCCFGGGGCLLVGDWTLAVVGCFLSSWSSSGVSEL